MPGLPDEIEEIPIEYFDGALDWLQKHPSVDPERIGILGGSRGAILLLSGENDEFWPSAYMSQSVLERLERLGHPYPHEHFMYPKTGHQPPLDDTLRRSVTFLDAHLRRCIAAAGDLPRRFR